MRHYKWINSIKIKLNQIYLINENHYFFCKCFVKWYSLTLLNDIDFKSNKMLNK